MKKYGALLTTLLAAVVLFALFHQLILNANQRSFAGDGDGLKSTFGTVYHLKFDEDYWHSYAMNYPYGESVFFMGNQVGLTSCLKVLKDAGWDLSDYAMGISNILILLSYVLAALFIYLIFRELKVGPWMALPASLLIMILSNQWERLGGHYNLAYAHMIPLILYLLLRFYRKPGYILSLIFGLLVIVFSAKNLYVTVFILVLWAPYWLFLFISDREKFGKPWFLLSHLLIQFILPFVLFYVFSGVQDMASDRTAYPWGFYQSRIRWEAVFLPEGLPHLKWLDVKGVLRSKAYVGLLGSVVALVVLFKTSRGLIRRKGISSFEVSGNQAWNILFWAGVISLLIAFGFPFSRHQWPDLLNYTGPFRQFRAIGRFVFPFYYTMSITSFYFLWKWFGTTKMKIRIPVLILVLLFASFESVSYIWKRPALHNHPITWHSDLYNRGEDDEWLNKHDFSEYQSILTLPYFHIGSENYWTGDRNGAMVPSFAASLGTGLPLHAVMLSRTSISQTLANLDLSWEAYHEYPVLEELPDHRPLLLMTVKKRGLSMAEWALVSKATYLDEGAKVKLYALTIDSIRSLVDDRQAELRALSEHPGNKRESCFYMDFSSEEGGVFSREFMEAVPLIDTIVPDTGQYKVSFWFEGADKDLWPRTVFWTDVYDEEGKKYFYKYTDFFRQTILRDGSEGLIEYRVHVKEPGSRMKITFRNNIITGGEMVIDRVLLRPETQHFVVEEEGETWVDNRRLK